MPGTVTRSSTPTRRKTTIRVEIAVAVVIAFVFVPIAAGAWMLHHVDRYLPDLIAYIQKETGKQIEIGHATVSLFPLTVRLYDVGIKNSTPFPEGYFLKVPGVEAVVEAGPLLRRQIVIQTLILDQPVIDFISNPDGLWNFQNPVAPNQPAQQPMRLTLGSIASLKINKGTLLGSSLINPPNTRGPDTPGPIVLQIQNFSARVKQIDFSAFRNSSASTVIAGTLDGEAARFGDIHMQNLQSRIQILPEQLTLKNFSAKTYRGTAHGDFTFNFAGKKPAFNTSFRVSGIGVPYLLAEFQTGPPAMTGMMEARLKLTGVIEHTADPLAGIQGAGLFTVRNGGFPSLNQNKSMAQMKRFRNPDAAAQPLSAFQTFGGDLEIRNRRIYNKAVALDFYGIAVDGSGNLDEVSGVLNYTGKATIMKKQGFFMNTFAKMLKGAKEKNGRLNFPIRLAGTLKSPECSISK